MSVIKLLEIIVVTYENTFPADESVYSVCMAFSLSVTLLSSLPPLPLERLYTSITGGGSGGSETPPHSAIVSLWNAGNRSVRPFRDSADSLRRVSGTGGPSPRWFKGS